MLKEWIIPVGGALVCVVAFMLVVDFSRQPRIELAPQIQPPASEILNRVVTSCAQLKQEINEMTQTTVELRKVIGDVVQLSCPKSAVEWIPPNPPPCPDDSFAALISEPGHYGYPSWACVNKETGKAPQQ